MSSSISNIINSRLRFTGMASGIDTDAIIEQLMKVENAKVDKVKQEKQLLEWKRDAYREIITALKSFNDTYMDVLSQTNMRSRDKYMVFSLSSSGSQYVSVKGLPEAMAGNHSIEVVNLAKPEIKQSSGRVTKDVTGNSITDIDAVNARGRNITITIDGKTKTIKIGNDINNLDDLKASLQLGIDTAFGSGKVKVDLTEENKLTFLAVGEGVSSIALSNSSVDDGLGTIGFYGGANFSNRLNVTDTLLQLSSKLKNGPITFVEVDGKSVVQLEINNKVFTFDKSTTLQSMMNQINSDTEAKVTIKYDEVSDKFVIASKNMGAGSNIEISETYSSFLSQVGLKQSSIEGYGSVDYGNLAGKAISVNINGILKTVTFEAGMSSASDIEDAINAAFAGTGQSVTVDDSTGKLVITSVTGAYIYVGDPKSGASALQDLKMTSSYVAGEDAKAIIDGQVITRSDNTFTVSGISYTLLKETEPGSEVNVSLTLDVDKIYDNIKAFIDKYNEVVDLINKKLSEKYDRNYQPLTDAQKEALSEDDIKRWEEKAKTGLLRNSSELQNLLFELRSAVYDSVEGIKGNITSIGITTGSYLENGKLVINETKLKEAIKNSPETVMDFFSKESSITYYKVLNDSSKKAARYKENGLVNRIYDIIQNNIRTMRDENDKKGVLIELAGIKGDITEYNSTLVNSIKEKDNKIGTLLDRLIDKEEYYYKKYAAMESYINQLNSQAAWMAQQFGTSQRY